MDEQIVDVIIYGHSFQIRKIDHDRYNIFFDNDFIQSECSADRAMQLLAQHTGATRTVF